MRILRLQQPSDGSRISEMGVEVGEEGTHCLWDPRSF